MLSILDSPPGVDAELQAKYENLQMAAVKVDITPSPIERAETRGRGIERLNACMARHNI